MYPASFMASTTANLEWQVGNPKGRGTDPTHFAFCPIFPSEKQLSSRILTWKDTHLLSNNCQLPLWACQQKTQRWQVITGNSSVLYQESPPKLKSFPHYPWSRLSYPFHTGSKENRKYNTQNSLRLSNLDSSPLLILQLTHPLRWQKGAWPVTPQLKDRCTAEPNSLMPQLLHPSAAHCWISDDLENHAQAKRSLRQTA